MKKLYTVLLGLALTAAALTAGVTTVASADAPAYKAAFMMDADTGTVVYEHNADERLPIASMVKIMTLQICFEEMSNGAFTPDTDITVSQNAASMGGSQAFLDANCSYKAGELIKSIVVASANDSCVAMAEHIAGSVEAFTGRMNDRAKALGMNNTYFVNCTGLPAPNQYSCARDAATMMRELIRYEKFFEYAGEWMYDFSHPSGRKTTLTNTNKLVRFYEGCDGGKTGFTNEAKSCLTATAKRGDTRFIATVIGAPDSKTRNAEMSKLLNDGFAKYATVKLVDKSVETDPVRVENGKTEYVRTAPACDFHHFAEKTANREITQTVEYYTVHAPVQAGDVVGKITLTDASGAVVGEVNIIATESAAKSGYGDIVNDFIGNW